jgi:hypothetical protein
VRRGVCYAIEAWVQSGRSLQVPRALRKTPFDIAITAGFHSLIELLLRHAPSQQAKNDALHQAVQRRRPEPLDALGSHDVGDTLVQWHHLRSCALMAAGGCRGR